MDMKLGVVIIPVSDVDRAKAFYGTGVSVRCRLRREWKLSGSAIYSSSIRGFDHLRQGSHVGQGWLG